MFAFLDDHSRLAVGYRFGFAEDTVRLAAALQPALAARGVPASVYVDNGSAYVDSWLLRACGKLGIRLIHSTPHRPQGRGKIERCLCATRRLLYPRFSREELGGRFLGLMAYLAAERWRGQEHARKPAAGSRRQGRCAGGPA